MEALHSVAPQYAALGDDALLLILGESRDDELGGEAQGEPLDVVSLDAVFGGQDYVEPEGGAPGGALLEERDHEGHPGAAPWGAVIVPL